MSIYQCTTEEIGYALGVCRQTFVTMTKRDPELRRRIALGQARGRRALRVAQFRVALGGNCNMLIWLGQAILDQIEAAKHDGTVELNEATKSHLIELAKHIQELAMTPQPEAEGSAVMRDLSNGHNGNSS